MLRKRPRAGGSAPSTFLSPAFAFCRNRAPGRRCASPNQGFDRPSYRKENSSRKSSAVRVRADCPGEHNLRSVPARAGERHVAFRVGRGVHDRCAVCPGRVSPQSDGRMLHAGLQSRHGNLQVPDRHFFQSVNWRHRPYGQQVPNHRDTFRADVRRPDNEGLCCQPQAQACERMYVGGRPAISPGTSSDIEKPAAALDVRRRRKPSQ